jgi:hypothetical protein
MGMPVALIMLAEAPAFFLTMDRSTAMMMLNPAYSSPCLDYLICAPGECLA